VSTVTVTAGFAETSTCSNVPASGTCTISVTFAPTASGDQNGTLTIGDNAQGNPHVVSLSGTGLAGNPQLSVSSLSFTALTVGKPSAAQTITLTNSGNGSFSVASLQATGDFAETNNCTMVTANGGTCAIQVTFTPTSSGARSGTIALTDSAANGPLLVTLTGSGIDFSMTTSSASQIIQPGAVATYSTSITPIGGSFSSAVSLACEGAPAFSTCTVNPTSVTPGANPSTVTVTVKTAGTSAQLASPGAAPRPVFAFWTISTGFGLFGMFLIGTKQGRKRASVLLLFMVLTTGMLFWVGCGGSKSSTPTPPAANSTPAGDYTVLVIGTSGSVQHFTSLTLTVK
jgi:hypothetical protein